MKTMTCQQLGGACEQQFRAETFEEIAQLSQQHGREMHQKQDAAHMKAMAEVQKLMQRPDDMKAWFESKRLEFEALPED